MPDTLLEGSKVTLRIPRKEDYSAFSEIINDKESMRALIPFFGKEKWKEDEISQIYDIFSEDFKDKKSVSFAILSKEKQKIVGTCGFKRLDHPERIAEFGIILHRDVWGSGISSECHQLCLDYAFQDLKVECVEFNTDEHNLRMQGFFKKHGIRFKGTTSHGYYQYFVTAQEWPFIRAKLLE